MLKLRWMLKLERNSFLVVALDVISSYSIGTGAELQRLFEHGARRIRE